jgi:hypothetical protein
MTTKKPKRLPDVWVILKEQSRIIWAGLEPAPVSMGEVLVRYTPAKSQKVCVWTEDGEYWLIACEGNHGHQIDARKFCPYCGGKIRTK